MYSPKPIKEHFLPAEDGHKVYFAEYGNPDGTPIVSLHGGPGSQCKPKHAGRLNLEKYRVIIFDQRGCGKSEYEDMLKENTTQKLVSDIERIREVLNIDNWFVTGGSWGSALSLVYAQTYPKSVRGLLVSAIFLGDQSSVDWFSSSVGSSTLYTDVWEHRNQSLVDCGLTEGATAQQINESLNNSEGEAQKKLVASTMNWEGNLMSAQSDVSYMTPDEVSEEDVTYAKIFMHYESNGFFFEPNQILSNVEKIKTVPMITVHGRHDILCPFKSAWDLHKAHGNSEIVPLPQSNHGFSADGEIARRYAFESFLLKHA